MDYYTKNAYFVKTEFLQNGQKISATHIVYITTQFIAGEFCAPARGENG